MEREQNTGKFTFHFDGKGKRTFASAFHDEHRKRVIPLEPGEYSVREERVIDQDAFAADANSEAEIEHKHEAEAEAFPGGNETAYEPFESGGGFSLHEEPGLSMAPPYLTVRRRPPAHWWKAALSVTAAIATGAALGLFVLNMLQQDDGAQNGRTDARSIAVSSLSGAGNPAAKAGDASAAASGASALAGGNAASPSGSVIEARTYAFLQNGVFATAAAADAAMNALQSKGLAAVAEKEGRTVVYAGLAPSSEDAQRLAQLLKDKKVEIYVKSVTLPALDLFHWPGTGKEGIADMIRSGDKLLRMMSGVTIAHLEEAQPTPFDQATVKAIKEAHQRWSTAAVNALKTGSGDAAAAGQSMVKAMGEAVAALDAYGSKPSASQLWSAQAAMMRYLLAQKQFQALIAAYA